MAEGHYEPEINEIQRQLSYFQRLLNSSNSVTNEQLEIFQGLLRANPELAETLDLQKRSLLHMASANGHIEFVRELIWARPEMCLARDQDGANPLHVAAMRGKVQVLEELLQAKPHAARARVDNRERETILHLCVKCDQLDCLMILLEKYFRVDEFVNTKDNAGNTILHLAVADQRREIVRNILFGTKIDVNAVNASKQTAMDILFIGKQKGSQLEWRDERIRDLLELCNAKTAREADILDPTEIAEKRSGIIVAAVLMATLAFQAGVAPPGGVWQDDSDGHKSGKAVMASNHPILYSFFLCYNILGFYLISRHTCFDDDRLALQARKICVADVYDYEHNNHIHCNYIFNFSCGGLTATETGADNKDCPCASSFCYTPVVINSNNCGHDKKNKLGLGEDKQT